MIRPRQWTTLLHELCVKHGHCGSRVHVTELLPTEGAISSQLFASLVLEAEEIDRTWSPLDYDQQHQLIRELFRQHMRSDQVQASEIADVR